MNRKLLVGLFLTVFLMICASAAWFVAANRFEAAFDAWIAAQRQQGLDLRYDARRIGGFPSSIRVALTSPRLTASNAVRTGTVWSWSSPDLEIAYSPFAGTVTLSAAGAQEIRFVGHADDIVTVAAAGLSAVLPAGDLGTQTLQLTLTAPRLTRSGTPFAAAAQQASARLTRHRVADPAALVSTADLAVAVAGLTVEQAGRAVLPAPLNGQADARVMGTMPAGSLRESVVFWRDAGGVINIDRLEIGLDDFILRGSGTIALDATNRLIGAMSAEIRDYDLALDRLVETGRVARADAQLARLMLAALAQPDPQTGKPTLTVPIAAQDGWLSVGALRLLKLEPIRLD